MGQGLSPWLCCRYKPKASINTHATQPKAKTRLGARSSTANSDDMMDYLEASSSALQDGEHTACDLPRIFLEIIWDRARCLPHKKHDMVAAPNEVAAVKGEPDTLDL
jgi:hypothetical protein